MTTFLSQPADGAAPADAQPGQAGDPAGGGGRTARWLGPMALAVVLLGGLYLVPLRALGLRLTNIPGDLIDGRFNNYVLEHGWRVLTGRQPRFWDAPFYYPEPGVIAWSDCHLGTLPIYAVFRAAGCDRETAYQAWLIVLCVLNYAAAAWVLRRLGASWLGAAAGAYVFAFCMPVAVKIGHPQLYPRCGVPLALYFAYRICSGGGLRCWVGLGASVVWQMYATLYNGYFLLLLLAVFVPACVLLRWRAELRQWVAQRGWWSPVFQVCLLVLAVAALPLPGPLSGALAVLALADACRYWGGLLWRGVCGGGWRPCLARAAVVALCVSATVPLLQPYLRVSADHRRPLDEVMMLSPRIYSWLSAPRSSLLWTSLNRNSAKVPVDHEHFIFQGALPTAALLAALGCVFARRYRPWRGFAAAGALAFAGVFLMTLHTESFCLYTYLYCLPGVNAFRGMARVGLVLAFPAAAALAYWLTAGQAWLTRRTGPAVAAVAVALVLPAVAADQALRRSGFVVVSKALCQERARRLAEQVRRQEPQARLLLNLDHRPEDARHDFYFRVTLQHLDAMMASQDLGIPTINGYSGWGPNDYGLFWTVPDLDFWKAGVRRRVGEDSLRRRVPGYAKSGFEGLTVVGRLRDVPPTPRTAAGRLPPAGYRCRLEIREVPAYAAAGDSFPLKVRVANEGPVSWPCLDRERVGLVYRWLKSGGQPADGIAEGKLWLANDVVPAGTVDLAEEVLTPPAPGEYILELDMVQDNVGRFSDRGGPPPVRRRVIIETPAAGPLSIT